MDHSRAGFVPTAVVLAALAAPSSAAISNLSIRLIGSAGYEDGPILERFDITGGLEILPFSESFYYESDLGDGVTGRTGASMDIDAASTSNGGLACTFDLESIGSVGPIDGFPAKYPIAESRSTVRFSFILDQAEQLDIAFGPVEGFTYSVDVFHNAVQIFELYTLSFDDVRSYLIDLPAGEIQISLGSYTNSYSNGGTNGLAGTFTLTPTPSATAVLGIAALGALRRRR